MRKIYFAMMAISAILFVSCMQQEQPFDDVKFGENDLVFTIGEPATKAGSFKPEITQGVSIPMGNDDQGNALFLDETIEELNPAPATKGVPAYTVNVGTLYPSMGVLATFDEEEADEVREFTAIDMYDHMGTPSDPNAPKGTNTVGDGWRYTYSYSGNPWTDDTTPVDFYFNMPLSPTGVNITSRANKQIKFTYSSPTTGAAQEDILFSTATYTKTQHDGYLPNGAPVLMYHALTGVKFRTGHLNDNPTKTIITKVVIKGLKSSGTATFTGSDFDWDVDETTANFSQEFKNQAWSAEAGVDGTVTYTPKDSTKFGNSWYAAAADKNLNDENGSLTFWFIPQEIDDNVTMEVTFRVKTKDTQDGEEITHEIAFGEKLNEGRTENLVWKAGQLRTYTLKPFDISVKIVDEMDGLTKSDLHVTNTGNVDEYVRMMVIGNWYGWETEADSLSYQNTGKPEPDIMVGYTTDGSDGTNVMVEPWFREDPVYGQYFDDSFKGGLPKAGRTDWVRGTGSYFYFTAKIGAGTTLDSATQALFQYYDLPEDKIPEIYIPIATSNKRVRACGVHLKMEIVVQAIGTTDPDGNEYADCWAAWSGATGEEIKIKP